MDDASLARDQVGVRLFLPGAAPVHPIEDEAADDPGNDGPTEKGEGVHLHREPKDDEDDKKDIEEQGE
jgi:hypothetical protein